MKHVDLFNIKLNHIRIFLAVAEYESFTIAAEKLHFTQPFVSKSILYLEEELGLYLFVRRHGKVQVTPAGRRLYTEWKDIMNHFEQSLTSAHSIQSGMTDKFQIGLGELNREENILIQNLRKTKEACPGADIYVEYNDMSSLVDYLLKRELDMIVISKHMLPVIEETNLAWQTLIQSQLSVFVHRSNPLFLRKNLEFRDLKKEQFIVFSSEKDDSYMKLLQNLSKAAGFTPMISCYIPNEISFQVNLELGNGIVLADSFSNLESENIKRFDLKERNDIIAVWNPDNLRECMEVFLSFFDECEPQLYG
jgi:DNA-binding transcriptional LysR family regulator